MKMISCALVLAILIISLGGCHGVGHWIGEGHYKHKHHKHGHHR
jgi:hypothetical protein